MSPDLSSRATAARELMDDPNANRAMLERTYTRFGIVNALVSRPGLLYRRDIRPRARERRIRILDIGAGGGDMCRMIAARLRREGLSADITALDADERAVKWAATHDDGARLRYRCASTHDLVDEGETFDLIFSNHVLHHLTASDLQRILLDSTRLVTPRGIVVHRDIARSRAAYASFAAATWPLDGTLFRGSFIREDGLISIRRSYTVQELCDIAPPGWDVRGGFPGRLELRWEADSD
jgi:2-polyprenyl-3-methyl-5-hydroxy-6-metoxy-1,4-benzoquinol methylase